MKNAVILHGIRGNAKENWFPWLQSQLIEKGYEVFLPNLPETNTPYLSLVYDFITKEFTFNEETLLIGHSSGGSLALGILQNLPEGTIVAKTILVAGFIDPHLQHAVFQYVSKDDYKNTFPQHWDFEKIKRASKEFVILHSSSDPFVQTRHGEFLQEKLDGVLIDIPDGKHFSMSTAGERYRQFPKLLQYI